MKLLYYKVAEGNFGDDLNRWFWDNVLPGWQEWQSHDYLLGVGTLFNRKFIPHDGKVLVLGSGVGYGTAPDIHSDPAHWDIRAVRGPRSAAALGLDTVKGVIDPAALLPRLARFAHVPQKSGVIFVPHHSSERMLDWDGVGKAVGIETVSPGGEAEAVIRRIASAKLVIAESMHAAIIADAFRVPWHAVSISNAFNDFKWHDWSESLGVDLRVERFFPLFRQIPRGRPAAGAAQAGEPSAATSAKPHVGYRTSGIVRSALEFSARRALRRLSTEPGQLSDAERLAQQCDRLERILQTVRDEHARP